MRRFSMLSAVGWSATWAIGVAVGVALGAYITVQGSAAVPGEVVLDTTELVRLPAAAGVTVFVLSLLLRMIAELVRSKRRGSS